MTKKIFFLSIALSNLLFSSCQKDSSAPAPSNTDVDLAKILAYPYSALSPAEQKVKLENESISFLDNMNAAKTSSAIEAFQNLDKLLEENSVEIIKGKDVNNVKRTVQYAEAYGVFTWDNAKRAWNKTASTTELKFVFPAKIGATTNTAVFSVKAVSSGISVVSKEYEWKWDDVKQENIKTTTYETTYYLPKSSTGILNINNIEAAKIELTAEYKDNKEAPVSSTFKITTNDGYVYFTNFNKATENNGSMKLTFNNKVLFEAVVNSSVKIDEIVNLSKNNTDIDNNLLGKANAYMKLTDNLVVVYTMDNENYAKECDAIENDYKTKTDALYNNIWETNKNFYTLKGQYEKEKYDKLAAAWGKYIVAVLVSTKDGSKIADLIEKSEKDGEETNNDFWDDTKKAWRRPSITWTGTEYKWIIWDDVARENVPYYGNTADTKKYDLYNIKYYLKFKDNTLVEGSAYFSEGFDKINEKWDSFVKAFDR